MPEQVRAGVTEVAAGGSFRQEITVNLPTGIRSFDFALRPVLDAEGKVIGIVPEAAETTERRLAEDALRQSQKMEAVGQLTGGVAHDFNNLLMAISGGLRMLERPMDPERLQRIKDGMQQAVQRGAGLTRQLLAFSRRRPLEAEPLDLGKQIAGMAELLERSLRGDIRVETHFATDLWTVEVDPGELELAVLNLCVNARDAMPFGGTIFIETQNVTLSSGSVAGEAVRLTVRDTGAGMSPETQRRVFEPFFTTKEVGKGSGLGLAQVYAFTTHSAGSVTIDSVVGRGTTIAMTFPRVLKGASPKESAPRKSSQRQTVDGNARGKLLLVEDDIDVALVTAEMLREAGYEVTHVTSAAAALNELAEGVRIDIVFSDVMLPDGASGVSLAGQIKERWPTLPVALATGYAESARGAEEDGVSVLQKPYEIDDLIDLLASLLDDGRVDPVRP